MIQKCFLSLMLATSLLGFIGCASTSETQDDGTEAVSTIPWNRPASWEGKGQLGGFVGGGY